MCGSVTDRGASPARYNSPVPAADPHHELRAGVRALCKNYPDTYWRELDAQRAYPEAFVRALTEAGS